jgi:type I restriction enzyme S subunit
MVTKNGIVPQLASAAKSDAGDNRKKVCTGDFVINSRSDRKGSSGVSSLSGSVSLISIVLEPQNYNPSYIHHLLRSQPFQEEFYRYGKGIVADLWSTNFSEMKNIIIPIPLPDEQADIANFLDQETGKIECLIEKQQKLIELTIEKIKSIVLTESFNTKNKAIRLKHLVNVMNRTVILKPDEQYTAIGLYNRGRGLFQKEPKEKNDMGDSDFFWVKQGDLIISGQFAWEGSVAIASELENGCVVSHRYPILRGKANILETEYLLALLMTSFGDFLLNESSRGAAGRNRPLN